MAKAPCPPPLPPYSCAFRLLRRRWEDRELADVALGTLDDDRGLEIGLEHADYPGVSERANRRSPLIKGHPAARCAAARFSSSWLRRRSSLIGCAFRTRLKAVELKRPHDFDPAESRLCYRVEFYTYQFQDIVRHRQSQSKPVRDEPDYLARAAEQLEAGGLITAAKSTSGGRKN
jgi:hypothetical protein